MLSRETVSNGLLFHTITTHSGLPTYKIIEEVHKKMNSNAASVWTMPGGGSHRLLGLVLTPAVCTTLTAINFFSPSNPGTTPIITPAATGPKISSMAQQHKVNHRIWRDFIATNQAILQHLIGIFEKSYICGLWNRHNGYRNKTTLIMLTHWYTTYGVITLADLKSNDDHIHALLDAISIINYIFNKTDTAAKYADASRGPYNADHVISQEYLLALHNELYKYACKEWWHCPQTQ